MSRHVFNPDDHDGWRPRPLHPAEHAWLAGKRRKAEAVELDPPAASRLPGMMQSTIDGWSIESGWVAVGLTASTATSPPPSRTDTGGTGGASDIADPVLAVTSTTLGAVTTAANRWAHLADDCTLDGQLVKVGQRDNEVRRHICPGGTAIAIADQLAVHLDDPADLIEQLRTVPPSEPALWADLVSRTARWFTVAASKIAGGWTDAWRAGAEEDLLRSTLRSTQELRRRTAAIAGDLAHWSGRTEATCKHPGCSRLPEPGRRECSRCRHRPTKETP